MLYFIVMLFVACIVVAVAGTIFVIAACYGLFRALVTALLNETESRRLRGR